MRKTRKRNEVYLRHYAMATLRDAGMTLEDIGKVVGLDAATVHYGIQSYHERVVIYGKNYWREVNEGE